MDERAYRPRRGERDRAFLQAARTIYAFARAPGLEFHQSFALKPSGTPKREHQHNLLKGGADVEPNLLIMLLVLIIVVRR